MSQTAALPQQQQNPWNYHSMVYVGHLPRARKDSPFYMCLWWRLSKDGLHLYRMTEKDPPAATTTGGYVTKEGLKAKTDIEIQEDE